MLKKIVSWISENPPEESLNEIIMEGSEKSFNKGTEAIETDEYCSSISTGTKTSISKRNLVEQNKIVDIQQCSQEKGENLFADGDKESVSAIIFDSNDDNIQTKEKEEKNKYNQLIQGRLSPIRNSFDTISLDDVVSKSDAVELAEKSSSTSNCESLPCFKNTYGLEHPTSSDTGCPKNVFRHTEIGDDKHCDGKTIKSSNKDSSFAVLDQEKKNEFFSICESSLAQYGEKYMKSESSESVYGTLFVVGCCKTVPEHLSEKMQTKYILRKRAKANGLVEAFSILTSDVKESLLSVSSGNHVILYRSNNNRTVVVLFKQDSLSDLFQIGRYEKYPVDFTVDDTSSQDQARHGVSRFACRISVSRDANHEARIYAGAFNSSQEISLSESCLAHNYCGKMDGFTTNGVLILKPGDKRSDNWREVSVSGYIYPLRSSTMDVAKRPRIPEESNVLIDGTLIDLCGVTLIWRTPEGLKKVPSEYYLNRLQSTLHKYSPEGALFYKDSCMVVSQSEWAVKKAYVYLSCGHVVGLALSRPPDTCSKGWSCPTCRSIGPIKEFTIGAEPGFYFAEEAPSYAAFKPCGHVATQKTANFWSSIGIPNHRGIHCSICPFCGQRLNFIHKYVKLTLPII